MIIKYLNILVFVVMVAMNFLANALPINNKTTGQLSAQYPNLFVPAGITFSIWGIIYLMLLAFLVIQFLGQNKDLVAAIGWAFAISCLLNAAWIISWHYEMLPLSLIIMLGLLVALIIINQRLLHFSPGFPRAVFGIYLGWICIATIANVTALLVDYNWGQWGLTQQSWAIIMIAAGAIISGVAMYKLDNPFMGLAVMWAFIGIILNRQSDYPSIAIMAFIGVAAIGAVTLILLYRQLSGTSMSV